MFHFKINFGMMCLTWLVNVKLWETNFELNLVRIKLLQFIYFEVILLQTTLLQEVQKVEIQKAKTGVDRLSCFNLIFNQRMAHI